MRKFIIKWGIYSSYQRGWWSNIKLIFAKNSSEESPWNVQILVDHACVVINNIKDPFLPSAPLASKLQHFWLGCEYENTMRRTQSVRHAYDEKSNGQAAALSFVSARTEASDGAAFPSYTNHRRNVVHIAAFLWILWGSGLLVLCIVLGRSFDLYNKYYI
jgi:hypothetical protein